MVDVDYEVVEDPQKEELPEPEETKAQVIEEKQETEKRDIVAEAKKRGDIPPREEKPSENPDLPQADMVTDEELIF